MSDSIIVEQTVNNTVEISTDAALQSVEIVTSSDSIIIEQTTNNAVEVVSDSSLQTLEVVAQGPRGQGIAVGGSTGQMLVKASATDYDTTWETPFNAASPPAIGYTTPAAGTFTTLTATGQTSLGGAAGSESFRALNLASSVNWIEAKGSVAGTGASGIPTLFVNGTDTNTQLGIGVKGASGYIKFFTSGAVGTEQMRIAAAVSAVNYVQVTGAATNGSPSIVAQGSDSFVGLNVQAKSATLGLGTRVGGNPSLQIVDTGSSPANYFRIVGAATTFSPVLSTVGSDTNISQVFQSKGTGAIDLAAGSRGVNISNGGTVTAITRTAGGSGYTSFPTWTASAPTTAGGSTASGTPASMTANGYTVASGGTGYTVGDVLTVTGGTGGNCTLTVTAVSAGAVTTATLATTLSYTALPTNPVSVTGGTGTGATFNLTYGIGATFTITNAGSGYVEQPTVSFSGGGGSGAAAYATVGSGATVKGLGSTLSFSLPSTELLRLTDAGTQTTAYWSVFQGSNTPVLRGIGTSQIVFESNSAVPLLFRTSSGTEQFRVSHTASAVNYVQVTGATTGSNPTISAQGSDTNAGLTLQSKGTFGFTFRNSSNGNIATITHAGSSTPNYVQLGANVSGQSPFLASTGTDTNVDLTLFTKGTGAVKINTGNGEQLRVSNTASAVNYVQVTGAATGNSVVMSSQGSDTNIGFQLRSKGTGDINLMTAGGANQVVVRNGGNGHNFLALRGSNTGSAVSAAAEGSDTNIDLTLTPKGTGNVRFGTLTASADAPITGYITIKDSGGTVRKLAVIA